MHGWPRGEGRRERRKGHRTSFLLFVLTGVRSERRTGKETEKRKKEEEEKRKSHHGHHLLLRPTLEDDCNSPDVYKEEKKKGEGEKKECNAIVS